MPRRRSVHLLALAAAMTGLTAAPLPAAAAAGWLAPQRLIDPVTKLGQGPVAAMNDAGDAAVAFEVTAPKASSGVYVATRAAGDPATAAHPRGFGDAVRVGTIPSNALGAGAQSLRLVVDDLGGATVAWTEPKVADPYGSGLQASEGLVRTSYHAAGGAWATPQGLAEVGHTHPWAPPPFKALELAATPGGGAVVSTNDWRAVRPPGATRFDEALRFGEIGGAGEFNRSTGTFDAALDDHGDLAVVYELPLEAPNKTQVRATVITPGGDWSAPAVVSSDVFTSPSVIGLADDHEVLVGTQPDDPDSVVHFDALTWDGAGHLTPLGSSLTSGWYETLDGVLRTGRDTLAGVTHLYGDDPEGAMPVFYRWPTSSPNQILAPAESERWSENLAGMRIVVRSDAPADRIVARLRTSPTAPYDGDQTVISTATAPAKAYRPGGVALDGEGNAVASWARTTTAGGFLVGVSALDQGPPKLEGLVVPVTAVAGVPADVSATATDRMTATAISWDFGDGSTASGAAARHAWAVPGTYTVTATATDEAGHSVSAARTIAVDAPRVPQTETGGGNGPGSGSSVGGEGGSGGAPSTGGAASGPGGGGGDRGQDGIGETSAGGALPTLALRLRLDRAKRAHGRTLVRRVTMRKVLAGDEITVTCSGGGCRSAARKHVTAKKAKASRALTFGRRGVVLAAGAKLTVTIVRAGSLPQQVTWTMRAGKKPKRT